MREVSISELERMDESSFLLIDTRSVDNVRYGMIPGAIHIPEAELIENAAHCARELPGDRTLIVYSFKAFRKWSTRADGTAVRHLRAESAPSNLTASGRLIPSQPSRDQD